MGRLLILLLCACCTSTHATTLISIDRKDISVCPATNDATQIPFFLSKECGKASFHQIDPQNTALWLKANLTVPNTYPINGKPSAIYVFGKMSSEVFFNGVLLGKNGTPSILNEKEFVGLMDARFYVPPSLIKRGKNEIIVYASSHHGLLKLSSPLHFIGMGEYAESTSYFQKNMLVPFTLLGAMLLGALYIATLAIQSVNAKTKWLLAVMLFSASGQLFVEMSRGLFNYTYPIHDLRLIAVLLFSMVFGFCFVLFSINKFVSAYKVYWVSGASILTLVSVSYVQGFDGKSSTAILIPVFISTVAAAYGYMRLKDKRLLWYLLAYIAFLAIILLTFLKFHDSYFYYIITAMMAFFVVREANDFVLEKSLRKREEQQLIKLQVKLEQLAQAQTPSNLTLNSAGKTQKVTVNDILFCKAAGDYVDIVLSTKKTMLFSGSLKSLEAQLPTTFMKVHRSYLVNLDAITSLTSNNKGNGGLLSLKSGDEIPVSRRIFPEVKMAVRN